MLTRRRDAALVAVMLSVLASPIVAQVITPTYAYGEGEAFTTCGSFGLGMQEGGSLWSIGEGPFPGASGVGYGDGTNCERGESEFGVGCSVNADPLTGAGSLGYSEFGSIIGINGVIGTKLILVFNVIANVNATLAADLRVSL